MVAEPRSNHVFPGANRRNNLDKLVEVYSRIIDEIGSADVLDYVQFADVPEYFPTTGSAQSAEFIRAIHGE